MPITAFALKERHREIRDGQPDALRLRIHRSLSWLIRSEQEADDPDTRFILQWIALNAAYAREFGREETERDRARGFVETLVRLDANKRLHQALFQQFTAAALIAGKCDKVGQQLGEDPRVIDKVIEQPLHHLFNLLVQAVALLRIVLAPA